MTKQDHKAFLLCYQVFQGLWRNERNKKEEGIRWRKKSCIGFDTLQVSQKIAISLKGVQDTGSLAKQTNQLSKAVYYTVKAQI